MNKMARVFLVILSLTMLAGTIPTALADDAGSVAGMPWDSFSLNDETFGPLRIGMPAKELREILGEGKQAGEPELWGADGLEHWDVSYDLLGLTVGLARAERDEDSGFVFSILAVGPFDWKTARGLGIGDPVELVKSLYGDVINPEWNTETSQGVLIGSLYGGILAGLTEGVVVSLYFGAMAE